MNWTRDSFAAWLDAYGAAWQSKDSSAFAALFTEDCAYYWTPLDPPYVGHEAIAGAFTRAVATQESIAFSASIVSVDAQTAVARWRCTLVRRPEGHGVVIDGVLLARCDPDGRCAEFREWWHRQEPASTT